MGDTVSAKDVKALREATGVGMMDCKEALKEAGGDFDKAIEILRIKGQASAAKRGDRAASEGTVQSYIHANGSVGVLVEINCETDFVSRNDEFVAFTKDIALHIAAASPKYLSEADIPEEELAHERQIFIDQASDKPENIREKIADGKLRKWFEDIVLLNQVHVNADKYEGKTIEQIRTEVAAKTGENVVIRRFARFAVGE